MFFLWYIFQSNNIDKKTKKEYAYILKIKYKKMSILSQFMSSSRNIKVVAIIAISILVIIPSFVMSSRYSKLYVDENASGTQDGSSEHPFKTIKQAMKEAKKNTEIHVAKGTYKENVEMKNDTEIYGEDKDDVIIEASNDDEPVVTMEDDTVINKVTLKKGSYGVKVYDKAEVSIIDCIIKDNKKDGIYIKEDSVKESRRVSISENEIKNNDMAGIYSGRRSLSIVDNDISDNDGDGIDIEKGSNAWIADNRINGNDKSGMKLSIDGSNIWTKNNSIRKNNREGIEVSFSGVAGRIDISKSKIMENDRFGTARVQRATVSNSSSLWSQYLTFDDNNTFSENKFGNISSVFVIQ